MFLFLLIKNDMKMTFPQCRAEVWNLLPEALQIYPLSLHSGFVGGVLAVRGQHSNTGRSDLAGPPWRALGSSCLSPLNTAPLPQEVFPTPTEVQGPLSCTQCYCYCSCFSWKRKGFLCNQVFVIGKTERSISPHPTLIIDFISFLDPEAASFTSVQNEREVAFCLSGRREHGHTRNALCLFALLGCNLCLPNSKYLWSARGLSSWGTDRKRCDPCPGGAPDFFETFLNSEYSRGKASLLFHALSCPCRRGHQKSVSLTSFW